MSETPRFSSWRSLLYLLPAIGIWLVLVVWLAQLLHDRAYWSDTADEALIREWLDETRNFRKSLPELLREYLRLRDGDKSSPETLSKRDEISEHLAAIAEPTRAYANQLPSFPVIYRVSVIPLGDDELVWDSGLSRPHSGGRKLVYAPLESEPTLRDRITIHCDYQLHAFSRLQRQVEERRRLELLSGLVLVLATLVAALFAQRFLQRERDRERRRAAALAEAEHQKRELLETRLNHQEAERARQELDRKLLQNQLEAADLKLRADEAERNSLEMKSRLFAGIGIMAGSYAHNIKNLLVRPNDLLARCLESPQVPPDQQGMLREVRETLGTVTERLQQILKTVRRDPTRSEMGQVDLVTLIREIVSAWQLVGREKWKVEITVDLPDEPLWVHGDFSHLQQVFENLLFNARDATFEMRNHLRESARSEKVDPTERKRRLIEAAGRFGHIQLSVGKEGERIVVRVKDDGIGMTEEVRAACTRPHFSTKKDNALYEGYSAGMGLGLSFSATVLEHHEAILEIFSRPLEGTEFRIAFPRLESRG